MSYWNTASLYGGWQIPEDITKVKTPGELTEIGSAIAGTLRAVGADGQIVLSDLVSFLPATLRKYIDDLGVQNMVFMAVGLKYVLDSLTVKAHTAPSEVASMQYKMTALAYKDAYAPVISSPTYKAVVRYYSGMPPNNKAVTMERMADFLKPETPYTRQSINGYLRTDVGTPYLGTVNGTPYRIYEPIPPDTKRNERLKILQRRGATMLGTIPTVPKIFNQYISARNAERANAALRAKGKNRKSPSEIRAKALAKLNARTGTWFPTRLATTTSVVPNVPPTAEAMDVEGALPSVASTA